MKKTLLALLAIAFCYNLSAQDQGHAHGRSDTYTWPEEKEVLQKLDKWQDQKFGLLIHWGVYSELGIVESWSICAEEEDWIGRDSTIAYDQYKRDYWAVKDRFNPQKFDPDNWAEVAKAAGMKYVIFTTKHHDGFCLFDTKETDFSIMNGPFGKHPKANAAKEVFNSFRNNGFMIGAYFSKPDWHSQYYWWDRYATPNRNNNYDIKKNPWRWNKFKEFTYNQIEELTNGDYGAIDILWLDGGWVRPARDYDAPRWGRAYKGEQDVDMPRIASMVRSYQPDMLIVDRTVPGKYENYQTPERGVPDTRLDNPWESCIPLGYDWGYTKTDIYKTPAKVIHLLVEIVAKNGSLALGIGPKPDGTLPEDMVVRLNKIGEWLGKNQEAIYNTRSCEYYNDGNTWFTQSKDGKRIYATVCLEEGKSVPQTVVWKGCEPKAGQKIIFLETGKAVKWKKTADGIEVSVPRNLPTDQPAVAFSFAAAK